MLLLLFVYIFGGTMSAGIGGGGRDRLHRLHRPRHPADDRRLHRRSAPRSSVSNDMTEGIIARFRTMADPPRLRPRRARRRQRPAVASSAWSWSAPSPWPSASAPPTPPPWSGWRRSACSSLFALALTWIAVGMGLISPTAEAASNNAMPLILLPLLSSAFVPIDSMPGWFQPIAEYQPFTPAIETLRGLLLGTEIGNNGWLAVAWCLVPRGLGCFWSTLEVNKRTAKWPPEAAPYRLPLGVRGFGADRRLGQPAIASGRGSRAPRSYARGSRPRRAAR